MLNIGKCQNTTNILMKTYSFVNKRTWLPRSLRWFSATANSEYNTKSSINGEMMSVSNVKIALEDEIVVKEMENVQGSNNVCNHDMNQNLAANLYEPLKHPPLPTDPPPEIPPPPPPLPPTPSPLPQATSFTNVLQYTSSSSSLELHNHESVDMELSTPEHQSMEQMPDNIAAEAKTSTASSTSHGMSGTAKAFTRDWTITKFGTYYSKRNCTTFTLMSYNILAQGLLDSMKDLYRHNEPHALLWENRLNRLTEEISNIQPNILALQELQFDHINGIAIRMKNIHLNKYLYKKRTGNQDDGCAIFYNGDLYELIDHEMVEYFQPNLEVI